MWATSGSIVVAGWEFHLSAGNLDHWSGMVVLNAGELVKGIVDVATVFCSISGYLLTV